MSLLRMHTKLGGNAYFESYQLKFSQETTIQRLILASGTLCLESVARIHLRAQMQSNWEAVVLSVLWAG